MKEMKWRDLATGLYNRQYLVERLDKLVGAEMTSEHESSLLDIDIDHYAERVQASFGVAGADLARADLAGLLREQVQEGEILARFGDTAFTILIPRITADAAIQRAESLCKTIEDHIVDVNHKTRRLTASRGLHFTTETPPSAGAAIDHRTRPWN